MAHYYTGYILGILAQGFWIWMLIDCIMNDPDRFIWIWVILFLNFPGALIYFFARKPISMKGMTPSFISGLMRSRETAEAENAVRNVENPYNLAKLGDIYFDTGRISKAAGAYDRALKIDPGEIRALWGSARVNMINKETSSAKVKLEKLLKKDPGYSYGDPSLAYGRILFNERDKGALAFFEHHITKWGQPEAQYMLGVLLVENNEAEKAVLLQRQQEMDKQNESGPRRNENYVGAAPCGGPNQLLTVLY
jgi:hypothetical protein